MKTEGYVWSFDLGKGSIGEAVRKGNEFLHKESLLIPAEFADTKPAATRRRMWRTRIAHRERERWLEEVWQATGLEVLYGRNRDKETGEWKAGERGDERLEREFAAAGDNTCYTSCLLRIKLLNCDPELKEWQVFKALRSAIQKRGYGKVPWAEREARRAGKSMEDAEQEEAGKDPNYLAALNKWRDFKKAAPAQFHFPCYFDAWKMDLWSPDAKRRCRARLTHEAESTRNVRFDREDVRNEIATLGNNAAKLVPKLAKAFARFRREGWDRRDTETGKVRHYPVRAESFGDFLCYGPGGTAYASFTPELGEEVGLHMGSRDDWMGALGQKVPRFDNRILEECVLIPRYHVCKAEIRRDAKTGLPFAESLLSAEVTFLMKLKNTLVEDGGGQRKLTAEEVRKIFAVVSAEAQAVKPNVKNWSQSVAERFALTKADWGRQKGIEELGLRPLPGHEVIRAPKHSGRSGFSRPALRLLKELVLSDKSPREFHRETLERVKGNKDPKKGLVPGDLKFLQDMGETWEDIHIPAQKLEALAARHTEGGRLDGEGAVSELLGSIKDPVVRHRLSVFGERCRELRKEHGVPEEVVLEFVREDFMGPARKAELLQFQREREKARKEARERAKEAGAEEKSAALKYELCKAQGCTCLYCGQAFAMTRLEDYEVEHIVPRKQGGPDAMVNYVLAHRECNETKGEQTPYQWWHNQGRGKAPAIGWDAYSKLVAKHGTLLRNKKVQLLTNHEAPQLVERYTALAETAWVSKLAQTIVSLFFGWKNGVDASGRKRVTVVSGGLTARVRRNYRLNSLLNPCPTGEDPVVWEEQCEKNRSDDRHHALDAMVISFIPGWAPDEAKEHFFRFPKAIHKNAREFFGRQLEGVTPRSIARLKPAMEETFYGVRRLGDAEYIVKRRPLVDLATKEVKGKLVLKPRGDIKPQKIVDGAIRRLVEEFLGEHPEMTLKEWQEWCEGVRLGPTGPRIRQVLVTESEPDGLAEYGDFGKTEDGSRGQYRRAATHAGYFVVSVPAGTKGEPARRKIEVRPVFAFQSRKAVEQELRKQAGLEVVDYFWSNCQVTLARPWEFKGESWPAGEYTLKTLWAGGQGRAKLKHASRGLIGERPSLDFHGTQLT